MKVGNRAGWARFCVPRVWAMGSGCGGGGGTAAAAAGSSTGRCWVVVVPSWWCGVPSGCGGC